MQQLLDTGKTLDDFVVENGVTITKRDQKMKEYLQIRDKSGCKAPFILNEAQRQIAARWGKKNIMLKARQLGMTTYVAARFFIETITRPGTLTVMVAHDQRSAEDIFRMVHRFQENLPEALKQGALKTPVQMCGNWCGPRWIASSALNPRPIRTPAGGAPFAICIVRK